MKWTIQIFYDAHDERKPDAYGEASGLRSVLVVSSVASLSEEGEVKC